MTPEEHRACAAHNDGFWQAVDGKKWPGWVITGIFYTALHEVQAFLIEHDEDPRGHQCRQIVLSDKWPDVEEPYTRLGRLSHAARYKNRHSAERLNDAKLLLVKVRGQIAAEP